MQLRDYQCDAVDFLLRAVEDKNARNSAVVTPTGSGKSTIVSAALAIFYSEKRYKKFTHHIVAVPMGHIATSFTVGTNREYVLCDQRNVTFRGFWGSNKGTADTSAITKYLAAKRPTKPLLTTHQAIVMRYSDALSDLPKDCSGIVLYIDEAHRMSAIGKKDFATKLTQVANEIHKRGGHVSYITASPVRGDGKAVIPDDAVRYVRSISEHAAEGFCPRNLRSSINVIQGYHASSVKELLGEAVGELTEDAAEQIANVWVDDGKPKVVINIPAISWQQWANKLKSEFEKRNARVLIAVGDDAKQELNALVHENNITKYKDSQLDVIIACRRFDEGSDWPLCSHVYNIGITTSFRLLIQRLGRALRLKYEEGTKIPKFKGMPKRHLDSATIRFFIPEGESSLYENLWGSHHAQIILLACFLYDFETGQEYLKVRDSLFSKIETIKRKEKSLTDSVDKIQSIFRTTDIERASSENILEQICNDIKAQCGPNHKVSIKEVCEFLKENKDNPAIAALSVREIGALLTRLGQEGATNEKFLKRLCQGLGGAVEKLARSSTKTMPTKRENSLIKTELLESFLGVVEDFGHVMVSDRSTKNQIIASFNLGREPRQIAQVLLNRDFKLLDRELVKYKKLNGRYPYSNDSKEWRLWQTWLIRHQGTSLASYIQRNFEQTHSLTFGRTLEQIDEAIKKYYEKNGCYPRAKNKATDEETKVWNRHSLFLKRKCGMWLTQYIAEKFDKDHAPEPKTFARLDKELAQYVKENGRFPEVSLGKWRPWTKWLRHNHNTTLTLYIEKKYETEVKPKHSIENIEAGIREFYKKTKKFPTPNSDACWRRRDTWLRRNGYGSLPQLIAKKFKKNR